MQCPVCKTAQLLSERQGVEIDYCPQCRGVWLDRGELDKLIERSQVASPASPAPVQQQRAAQVHTQGHGWGQQRKKKGFLGEIFDFD